MPRAAAALLAAFAALCAAAGSALAESPFGAAAARLGVPGAVVVRATGNAAPRFEVTGCARFAADGVTCVVALRTDSLMRVASITKFATALGTLRLVEEGRLDLGSDVSKWLGFPLRNPAFPDRVITLRHLLTHTSSLIDGEEYFVPRPEPVRKLLDMPGRYDTAQPPGACTRYANLNTFLVGAIVEAATNELFEQFLARAVLQPLGLEAGINWYGLESLPGDRVAAIYLKPEDNATAAAPWIASIDDFAGGPPQRNPAYLSPQGGLRISAAGLVRLGQQLLPSASEKLLKSETMQAMLAPALVEPGPPACNPTDKDSQGRFGLGVQVLRYGDRTWTGHLGEAYGLRGALLVDRERGDILVYLVNGSIAPLPGDADILAALGAP
jgi:CubicO group peptidase (beta-lactamase class C family)